VSCPFPFSLYIASHRLRRCLKKKKKKNRKIKEIPLLVYPLLPRGKKGEGRKRLLTKSLSFYLLLPSHHVLQCPKKKGWRRKNKKINLFYTCVPISTVSGGKLHPIRQSKKKGADMLLSILRCEVMGKKGKGEGRWPGRSSQNIAFGPGRLQQKKRKLKGKKGGGKEGTSQSKFSIGVGGGGKFGKKEKKKERQRWKTAATDQCPGKASPPGYFRWLCFEDFEQGKEEKKRGEREEKTPAKTNSPKPLVEVHRGKRKGQEDTPRPSLDDSPSLLCHVFAGNKWRLGLGGKQGKKKGKKKGGRGRKKRDGRPFCDLFQGRNGAGLKQDPVEKEGESGASITS